MYSPEEGQQALAMVAGMHEQWKQLYLRDISDIRCMSPSQELFDLHHQLSAVLRRFEFREIDDEENEDDPQREVEEAVRAIQSSISVAGSWLNPDRSEGELVLVVRQQHSGEISGRVRVPIWAKLKDLRWAVASVVGDKGVFRMMFGDCVLRKAADTVGTAGMTEGAVVDVVWTDLASTT